MISRQARSWCAKVLIVFGYKCSPLDGWWQNYSGGSLFPLNLWHILSCHSKALLWTSPWCFWTSPQNQSNAPSNHHLFFSLRTPPVVFPQPASLASVSCLLSPWSHQRIPPPDSGAAHLVKTAVPRSRMPAPGPPELMPQGQEWGTLPGIRGAPPLDHHCVWCQALEPECLCTPPLRACPRKQLL